MGEHAKPHRKSIPIIGLAGAVAAVGLFGLTESAQAAACEKSGGTITCTFNNPNGPEDFTRPAGVTSATITLQGGSGGSGAYVGPSPNSNGGGGGFGGGGGIVSALVDLTPYPSLSIFVGSGGGNGIGCQTGNAGGIPGTSGGVPTGGVGGAAMTGVDGPDPDMTADTFACAGGGGGGGSYVMPGGQSPAAIEWEGLEDTPDSVSVGATPVLAAGGGGGGGGGWLDDAPNDGGVGGTNTVPPGNGGGERGGERGDHFGGGDTLEEFGEDGAPGTAPAQPAQTIGGSGGGGGGYLGGDGGFGEAFGPEVMSNPGSGGGGGMAFPAAPDEPDEDVAVVPAMALPASGPTNLLGSVSYAVAAAGSPGGITISFPDPGGGTISNKDTAVCNPDVGKCAADPPPGKETDFHVLATGGTGDAVLFAILNGGPPPTCKSVGGNLSPDWVQFGFEDPKDGRTWSKKIRVNGTDPTSKEQARRILAQTQICFAAPYPFVVKRGFKLELPNGGPFWEGLLAHCKSRIVAQAKQNNPDLARPCINKRAVVQKGDGWVVQVKYFVPNGELDPQGRSVRKKGKKKHR